MNVYTYTYWYVYVCVQKKKTLIYVFKCFLYYVKYINRIPFGGILSRISEKKSWNHLDISFALIQLNLIHRADFISPRRNICIIHDQFFFFFFFRLRGLPSSPGRKSDNRICDNIHACVRRCYASWSFQP